ncbi:WD40 repeat-like protein [Thelephora ganbajun]|uniref:WD40 repeat-like protein n=1 Tax=Thelephora ganbajun TaxID=370292 RepID=A0ACB6Z5Y7_THEGA|nr:WD40 repeat-like protein [Thelephora ganbajun]
MENDSTFVAPEGVYSVIEEHRPSTVNPHVTNTNVPPASYPTKLSTILIRYPAHNKASGSQAFAQLLGGGKEKDAKKDKSKTDDAGKDKDKDKDNHLKPPTRERDDGVSLSSSDTQDDGGNASPDLSAGSPPVPDVPNTPAHEHLNTIFSTHSPSNVSGGKKKASTRPKHSIRTTSSTFVSRIQTAEGLAKHLQSRQGEVTYVFYNHLKSFIWTEVGSKVKEPLVRLFFSAYPTCHDVNPATTSPDRMDIIIGFNTGDIIWFDPISNRYCRLNKQGRISSSRCTAVRWVPSSQTLFLVAHVDGTVIVYDRDREDGAFVPQEPTLSSTSISTSTNGSGSLSSSSQGEWNPLDSIFVTLPPWHPVSVANGAGKSDRDKSAKNPVSHWRVSKRSVVDFVFSPDVKYVAAISEDGCLRVIDAMAEQLVDCYASYFGALTAVAWSPDGRFILTGGQDDLITIYSPWEQRVVARCQGHSSFVSGLAFDEIRCDGRTYRFGSVGEDNKFILWDFSSGSLHRPKLITYFQATYHQRLSMASSLSLAVRRRGDSIANLPPGGLVDGKLPPLPHYHPSPSRNEVAVVQPVLVKPFDADLLTDVKFISNAVVTANKGGLIKYWVRPLPTARRVPHHRTSTTHTGPSTSVSKDVDLPPPRQTSGPISLGV